MKISFASIFVDDPDEALRFYTDVLGFLPKADIPLGGGARWITVVSPDAPDGPELVLEPSTHPAVPPFKAALVEDGIPFTMFAVDDIEAEVARLKGLGVRFLTEPTDVGTVVIAVLEDGQGNLLQVAQMKPAG